MKAIAFCLVAAIALVSCTKENTCSSGTGGSLTFVVLPQHHGAPIHSQGNYRDTVMVKFNTQEFPGASPSLYDLIVVGDSGEDHVHIDGLKCGDYYLFATGFDTTISERVFGGRPFSTEATSGQLEIEVSVSE